MGAALASAGIDGLVPLFGSFAGCIRTVGSTHDGRRGTECILYGGGNFIPGIRMAFHHQILSPAPVFQTQRFSCLLPIQ